MVTLTVKVGVDVRLDEAQPDIADEDLLVRDASLVKRTPVDGLVILLEERVGEDSKVDLVDDTVAVHITTIDRRSVRRRTHYDNDKGKEGPASRR